MRKILFVCSRNTCRSPMAVSILKNILRKNNVDKKYSISSAGLNARVGEPMNEHAIKALKDNNVNVCKHTGEQISVQTINDNDLVITMTQEQQEFLSAFTNVYSLKQLTSVNDITDPYGEDQSVYDEVCKDLIKSLNVLFNKLEEKELTL